MAEVVLDRVRKVYPQGGHVAIEEASFSIADGERLVLVGPSGCGKSTLLRMIAGLEPITSGELRIGGRVVNELPPKERDIAMVFQSYALYPHMSVARNLGFALELRGMVMNEWRFEHDGKQSALRFTPAMVCDDGALLRQWVLADAGIASKSWWDVKRDVEQGRLRLLFAESFIGFSRFDKKNVGLQFVYPQRRLQPLPVTAFTQFFIDWLENE